VFFISITINTYPITQEIINKTSINDELISPINGTNIKLINKTTPSETFVGVVTDLIPEIVNFNTGIYYGLIVDGVDNYGKKKKIIITIYDLEINLYAGYDKLFYSNTLDDISGAIVYEEDVKSLVVYNKSIRVFSNDFKYGRLISYIDTNGKQESGIISYLSSDNTSVRIIAPIGEKIYQASNLSLEEATNPAFKGVILETKIT
jgi:hypothetical protein